MGVIFVASLLLIVWNGRFRAVASLPGGFVRQHDVRSVWWSILHVDETIFS
jgi:hypothetical protein